MPLFLSTRTDNGLVEHTTVSGEHTYDASVNCLETDIMDHDVEMGRSRSVLGHSDQSANNSNSKAASSYMEEPSLSSIGKSHASYSGPKIDGWPAAPHKLKGSSIPLFVGDMLLIILPVAFMVLGISAWRLDGEKPSHAGNRVERAMNLGPTIYPLAFAAIGSRCFRSIAIRSAERGTTLATLEKLLGSQSLVSAIGTACTLRSVSLLSLGVLLLWALSPLGGQSSLRLLHQGNSTVLESSTVYYSDHKAPINPDETSQWLPVVPAILAASLAASAQAKDLPVDLWNHPKIPRLEAIEQHGRYSPTTESDWIDVNATVEPRYSSWAGINVQNLRKTGSAGFQVRYNYLYLDCEKLYGSTEDKVVEYLLAANLTMYPPIPSAVTTAADGPLKFLESINSAEIKKRLSFFVQVAYTSLSINKFKNDTNHGFELLRQPVSFLYGAKFVGPNDLGNIFQVYTCTPHIVTVDAQIDCQSGNCAATRLRHVPSDSIQMLDSTCDNLYRLGCLTIATYALHPFMRYIPKILVTEMDTERSSPFDDWISGNNITYSGSLNAMDESTRQLEYIPDQTISDRLGTVLNTLWQGLAWGPQITRAALFERPEYPYQGTNTAAPERWINVTEASFSKLVPVYRADVGWIVTLLLITTILLLLSITNVVISFTTIAPDLFYYASSLTRENPYTNTPDGGTAMDGRERSRCLRAMKVQIADVSPKSQVGYVVLKCVCEDEDYKTGRLKKDRLYW